MSSISSEHIEITPGVCGGRPRIAGHRIRVQDIVVWFERQGRSPDEIVNDYPGISLADVYAALAYYYDNRNQIQDDLRADAEFIAEMKPKFPSKLAEKLARSNGTENPLPPG